MDDRQATLVRWTNSQTKLLDRRPAISLGKADINNDGLIAYPLRGAERLIQIMLHDGNQSRAVASANSRGSLSFQMPSINNRNQIAAAAYDGIMMIDANQRQKPTQELLPVEGIRGIDGVTLNDAGQIAFRVRRPLAGIYLVEGGAALVGVG